MTFVLWALIPAGLSVYMQSELLPGEQWGLSFWFLLMTPAWFVAGLMWALVWAVMQVPRRRVAVVFLATTFAGLAALWAVARMSPLYLLEGPVLRAFEQYSSRLEGQSIVCIESDVNLSGYGRFVREDAAASSDELGVILIGTKDESETLSLRRRATWMVDGCPHGVDALIALPLRDGWWYLYTDH